MRKLIYAIGVTLFLVFLAFHITTSLTNPYFGMSVEALAQGSGSGGSSNGGCANIDCRSECDEDHSIPPLSYSKEHTNTTFCCEEVYSFYDNGVLTQYTITRYHEDRICVSSSTLTYCFKCIEGGNNS